MKYYKVLIFLILSAPLLANSPLKKIKRSLYKIQVTKQAPNYRTPWAKQSIYKAKGSGFYIGNNQIITNAHVVENARYITVLRYGDSKKRQAYIEFIAHDCDIATLTLKDKEYFKDTTPLALGSLPEVHSPVSTLGFPLGGEHLSITQGIISRIDYRNYTHSGGRSHILAQVDSAINPGNSGGPVIQKQKVIGIAFQAARTAENTGYIIPTPVIKRFIKDIKDGSYDGHPESGLLIQKDYLSNQASRKFHGLDEKTEGVMISYQYSWSPTATHLRPGDILLEIDKHPIGIDGQILFGQERVSYESIFDLKQYKDQIEYLVWRNKQKLKIKFSIVKKKLLPYIGYQYSDPAYFVYGGLVFTILSLNYLKLWGGFWKNKAPLSLRYLYKHAPFLEKFNKRKRLVVISHILPHKTNTYSHFALHKVIDTLNETPILSLQQLYGLMKNSNKDKLKITLFDSYKPLVLSRKKLMEYQKEINTIYGVEPHFRL